MGSKRWRDRWKNETHKTNIWIPKLVASKIQRTFIIFDISKLYFKYFKNILKYCIYTLDSFLNSYRYFAQKSKNILDLSWLLIYKLRHPRIRWNTRQKSERLLFQRHGVSYVYVLSRSSQIFNFVNSLYFCY